MTLEFEVVRLKKDIGCHGVAHCLLRRLKRNTGISIRRIRAQRYIQLSIVITKRACYRVKGFEGSSPLNAGGQTCDAYARLYNVGSDLLRDTARSSISLGLICRFTVISHSRRPARYQAELRGLNLV